VLEGVKADHDESAAGREQLLRLTKPGLERVELAIDRDADRLKRTGRGMQLRLAAAGGARDHVGELRRRRQRRFLPRADDRRGDRAGPRLLSVLAEHSRELV